MDFFKIFRKKSSNKLLENGLNRMKLEEFNEYLKHLDPVKKEVANNWKVGIGLQAVDGLHVSEFLLDIAKRNIDGEITIDEAIALIEAHYKDR